jgi:DNA-binding transcriptional MerR regulator
MIPMENSLPSIPAKRYFTIGEVSDLCGVKPYVLRYWEQEFTQLKPMKRRGNRRYYQHHEVLLIRRIRELLYDQGFTISGARNRLSDQPTHAAEPAFDGALQATGGAQDEASLAPGRGSAETAAGLAAQGMTSPLGTLDLQLSSQDPPHRNVEPLILIWPPNPEQLRGELLSIREIVSL